MRMKNQVAVRDRLQAVFENTWQMLIKNW